jgi:hypothetical protein
MSSARRRPDGTESCATCAVASATGATAPLLMGGRPSSMSVERIRPHASRRSSLPRCRVCEAREEVKEDNPALGDEGNELGSWVLVSARRRGKNVETGHEGVETKSPMGRGQRS